MQQIGHGIPCPILQNSLFLFYFMDAPDGVSTCHMLEIEDEAA